jgi:hypothetical protein
MVSTAQRSGVLLQPPALAARADQQPIPGQGVLFTCALACAAGTIHLVAAVGHFSEYWLFGTFFLVLGVVQLAWSATVYRWPSRPVLRIGIWLSLSVVTIWIASRTTGLPLGPQRWSPEPIGPQDVAATLDELVVAALASSLLRHRLSWMPSARCGSAILLLLIASGVAAMVGLHTH